MIEEEIFAIRPTNEEKTDFIITIGNHLATKKHFRTIEEAKKYIEEVHWDMIVAVMAEIIEMEKKQVMINRGINKKEQK